MRITSYNILDGGEGRADPLAEVILAQKPDVVVLIEADVPHVVDRLSRRLNMPAYTGWGAAHTVAVLSRWPVLESIDHSAIEPSLDRGMIEVVVQTPTGLELPISAVHLPAGATRADEARRLQTWAKIDNRLKSHRDAHRPHLLCGDFNATAPLQQIDPARCKAKTRDAFAANGDRLPRELIAAVEAAGYTDTLAAALGDAAYLVGSFDTQTPGQRVDFIFTFGFEPSAHQSGWVETDRLAKYASDHFPVGLELSLTPQGGT